VCTLPPGGNELLIATPEDRMDFFSGAVGFGQTQARPSQKVIAQMRCMNPDIDTLLACAPPAPARNIVTS
jgi:hypothetical protein